MYATIALLGWYVMCGHVTIWHGEGLFGSLGLSNSLQGTPPRQPDQKQSGHSRAHPS